jgi:hypothetical protein
MSRGGYDAGERHELPDEPLGLLPGFADLVAYGRGRLASGFAGSLALTTRLRKLVVNVNGLCCYHLDELHSVAPFSNQDFVHIISTISSDKSRGPA